MTRIATVLTLAAAFATAAAAPAAGEEYPYQADCSDNLYVPITEDYRAGSYSCTEFYAGGRSFRCSYYSVPRVYVAECSGDDPNHPGTEDYCLRVRHPSGAGVSTDPDRILSGQTVRSRCVTGVASTQEALRQAIEDVLGRHVCIPVAGDEPLCIS